MKALLLVEKFQGFRACPPGTGDKSQVLYNFIDLPPLRKNFEYLSFSYF